MPIDEKKTGLDRLWDVLGWAAVMAIGHILIWVRADSTLMVLEERWKTYAIAAAGLLAVCLILVIALV